MTRVNLTLFLAGLVLGSVDVVTGAETDSLPMYYLDETIVTATRYELQLKDLSMTASLVTEDDINAVNSRTVADALAGLPGVYVNKTGDYGRADIDIRGIGDRGRSVMVLIDGRPVKMGLYGCTVTHTLPMNNVDHIEVVRGPASVLYGSDALGGVVNIITKKASTPLEGDFTASYGSNASQQYRLRAGGVYRKLDFYATGDYRTTDGHLAHSAYDGRDATGRVGYDIAPGISAILTGKYFDGYKEEPLRATDSDTMVADTWNDYHRWAIDLSVDGKWSRQDLTARVYRNSGEHKFSDGWHSTDYTNGAMFQASRGTLRHNRIAIGADCRQQGGKRVAIDSVPWAKYEYGVFVHDEQTILDRAILSAGARYHHDEISGDAVAPQAGCVLQVPTGTIFKASVSKGFRAPQINELYLFPASNTDLEPEIVWNYEVGINQKIIQGVSFEATGFILKGSNFIETIPNPTPPPLYAFDNVGNFEFRGVETGIVFQRQKSIAAHVFHSYLDPGKKTTGRPGHKTDASIRILHRGANVNLSGTYVADCFAADSSQKPIDDYCVLNAKLACHTVFDLEPFLAIDNVTNTEYAVYANLPGTEAGVYRMPGRSYTIGLSWVLK